MAWVVGYWFVFKIFVKVKIVIKDFFSDEQCNKRKSMLELMISISGGENGFTDIELREEVLTFLVAGTDTSTITVGNVLVLLGRYPEIQEQVYQEWVTSTYKYKSFNFNTY